MSHEVLITRRQSIFDFFANPGRGRPQKLGAGRCWLVGMLRPASAWICKKNKNALSSGYQDLMGHLILTTSPWSILTWITLVSSVEQHLICSALTTQLTYFQATFCGSKNWNCVLNHPPTLASLISKHVRLFFSQKKFSPVRSYYRLFIY